MRLQDEEINSNIICKASSRSREKIVPYVKLHRGDGTVELYWGQVASVCFCI